MTPAGQFAVVSVASTPPLGVNSAGWFCFPPRRWQLKSDSIATGRWQSNVKLDGTGHGFSSLTVEHALFLVFFLFLSLIFIAAMDCNFQSSRTCRESHEQKRDGIKQKLRPPPTKHTSVEAIAFPLHPHGCKWASHIPSRTVPSPWGIQPKFYFFKWYSLKS